MFDFFRAVPKKRTVRLNAKNGVIFHNPSNTAKSVFYLSNVCLLGAFLYLIYLYFPLAKVLINYNFVTKQENISVAEEKVKTEVAKTVVEEVPGRFKVEIPKIGADTWVVTNVSPDNEEEYKNILSEGVIAHAKTSSLPGQGMGTSSFLFAHSSEANINQVRTNPVFYLLGKMENDDKIFVDYNGRKLEYKVYDKKIIKANDVQYLEYADPSREVIILQTCWPIGTNWNRLLVFAESVK